MSRAIRSRGSSESLDPKHYIRIRVAKLFQAVAAKQALRDAADIGGPPKPIKQFPYSDSVRDDAPRVHVTASASGTGGCATREFGYPPLQSLRQP